MAKVEKTDQELTDDARAANESAPKNPRDAARAELLEKGTVQDRQAEIAKLQAEIDELSKPPLAEFPKMMYHPDQPAMTVTSAEQQDNLGDGWVESLADLPDVQEKLAKGSASAANDPAKAAHDDTVAGRRR